MKTWQPPTEKARVKEENAREQRYAERRKEDDRLRPGQIGAQRLARKLARKARARRRNAVQKASRRWNRG